MKYCTKCGASMEDDALFCPKCGEKTEGESKAVKLEPASKTGSSKIKKREDSLMTVALVFCIISCVLTGFALIPLCWMIPLTVVLYNKIQNKEPISLALKIVILIFVSLVAGILLIVGDESDE